MNALRGYQFSSTPDDKDRFIMSKFTLRNCITLFLAFVVLISAINTVNPTEATMTDPNPLESVRPHAVTMSVPDLDLAVRWYSEKLGFREVQRKSYPEFKTSLAFLELNGYRVELIEAGDSQPSVKRADPPAHTAMHGISQFSFLTTDLDGVRNELVRRGVSITWEFENAELGVKFLFIRDLNGNLIQYIQRLNK
jgi:catechol 2,3-dioxygenase-like lactoylglutathione lyase family enzyme